MLLSLLYLPTFILPDLILILCSKLLLFRQDRASFCAPRKVLGAIITIVTATASAAQISFYVETGGEIQWLAAGSLASDPGGIHMLMTGLPVFTISLLAFFAAAWLATPSFYDVTDNLLGGIFNAFKQLRVFMSTGRRSYMRIPDELNLDSSLHDEELPDKPVPSMRRALAISIAVISVIVTCITLQIVRPTTPPYAHMSGSLPFTMFESLFSNPRNTEFCLPHPREHVKFPFNEVFGNVTVEPAHDLFPGWMPQSETCHPKRHHSGDHGELSTLPSAQDGSEEYYESWVEPRGDRHRKHRPKVYNPSCDPLRITNLDKHILEPFEAVLSTQRPSIKHVVLLTLESTRKDMFPFRKESPIYDKILSTYEDASAAQHELNQKLSQLTPVADILTGETSGFDHPAENNGGEPSQTNWKSKLNEFHGGINVHGAITGSAFTFKSLLGSHCGVEPLPVDFTEEIKGRIYQPCVPQILDLFNEQQKNESSEKTSNKPNDKADFLSSPWESVLVQSITDQFDSQDILDEHMGFKNIVMKSTLLNPSSKYYPPKQEECNYFGFPETEVLPYLRDIFTKAEQDNRRLFLSHVTSTTHHPYSTPSNWTEHEDYLAKRRWGSEDSFNRYLNTIKYQDEWIGTIFDLLEEVGIFDQTLVVIVGDHGMAFDTPDGSSSTYENGHISNFHVPLLFLHPSLPRVQVNAKTTSLSIVPTILDLLIQTHSLNPTATETASRLIHQYQGQSLVRTFVPSKDGGRQLWYFGIINPGGSLLAISSAAAPWRLVLPLCSSAELRFTDLGSDPSEEHPVTDWTLEKLIKRVRKSHGDAAAAWVEHAEQLGRWWFWEQRSRWNYHKAARSTDRSAGDSQGGQIRKKHWWET